MTPNTAARQTQLPRPLSYSQKAPGSCAAATPCILATGLNAIQRMLNTTRNAWRPA